MQSIGWYVGGVNHRANPRTARSTISSRSRTDLRESEDHAIPTFLQILQEQIALSWQTERRGDTNDRHEGVLVPAGNEVWGTCV